MRLENFQITLRRQLLYYTFIDDNTLRSFVNLHDITREKNTTKGKISKGSKKKMYRILDLFTSCILANLVKTNIPTNQINKHITFITLTLSDTQKHSDKDIRRFLLNDFLRVLKRKENVKSYIYVSEAQKNGNIHFHIVIDKYIYHRKIRDYWNKIQDRYNYLDKYYNIHKHKNANSTDIHSLKKVNSIAAYLTKYFTKTQNRRSIEGHLWGCSDNLKELKPFTVLSDSTINSYIDYLYKINPKSIYQSDFFAILNNTNFLEFKNKCPKFYDDMINFYFNQYCEFM